MKSHSRSARALWVAIVTFALVGRAPLARAEAASSSITLEEAVAIARRNAPAVHAASARREIAASLVDAARAANRPTVSATLGGDAFASFGQVYYRGLISTGRR